MRSYKGSLSRYIWMALLVVATLFPALAIDPLGSNSPDGVATPVFAQAGTGWTGIWASTVGGKQGQNMELTQSGNKVTGYNFAADRNVACIIDPDNPNIARGNWDKTNRLLAEMTLSADGQTITVRTQFAEMKYFFPTETYTRRVSGASTGTATSTGTGTTTGTGAALVAESRTANPNSTVQVPIRLDKASSIGSMNFVLTYNAQVLKVNKVDSGSLLSGALFTPNFKTPPQVRFGLATSGGISGSGTVAYIEFQVIGAAGSSSPLTLSEVDATDTSGKSVTVTTQNGTVTVASGTADGAGGKVKGDYNGDGKVTELDALAALKMSVKLLPEDLILDMDGNGKVTAEDARLILKKALGK